MWCGVQTLGPSCLGLPKVKTWLGKFFHEICACWAFVWITRMPLMDCSSKKDLFLTHDVGELHQKWESRLLWDEVRDLDYLFLCRFPFLLPWWCLWRLQSRSSNLGLLVRRSFLCILFQCTLAQLQHYIRQKEKLLVSPSVLIFVQRQTKAEAEVSTFLFVTLDKTLCSISQASLVWWKTSLKVLEDATVQHILFGKSIRFDLLGPRRKHIHCTFISRWRTKSWKGCKSFLDNFPELRKPVNAISRCQLLIDILLPFFNILVLNSYKQRPTEHLI